MTKIIEGAKEALAIAKGEQPAAAIWHNGFKYVPSAEVEMMREALHQALGALKASGSEKGWAADAIRRALNGGKDG